MFYLICVHLGRQSKGRTFEHTLRLAGSPVPWSWDGEGMVNGWVEKYTCAQVSARGSITDYQLETSIVHDAWIEERIRVKTKIEFLRFPGRAKAEGKAESLGGI